MITAWSTRQGQLHLARGASSLITAPGPGHVDPGQVVIRGLGERLPLLARRGPEDAGAADLVATREPHAKWFVFSDDPAWCREHLKLPGESRFVESESPVSPAEDLAIMAACRHHIVANSTFSWWGARLATGSGVVVAPTRWTLGPEAPCGLLPDSWVGLANDPDRFGS